MGSLVSTSLDPLARRGPFCSRLLKIRLAAVVAFPLSHLGSDIVSLNRSGGIKHCRNTDNILKLEAKAIEFMMSNILDPGVVVLDQVVAYPSISRQLTFRFLKRMQEHAASTIHYSCLEEAIV